MQGENEKRNTALHSKALTLEELITVIKKHLSPMGAFAVLLPYHRSGYFEELSKQQAFYLNKKVSVKQTPNHNLFRSMLWFTQQQTTASHSEIIIQNEKGVYTKEFIDLLKNYYLHL